MRTVICMVVALGCMALAQETKNEGRCSSGSHECYNNTDNCIPNYQVCDGKEDCFYGDDELNCGSQNTTTTTTAETTSREPVSCSEGQYPCQAGICIPDTWLCDGTTDCPNYADDEQQCPTSAYTQRQAPEGKVPEGEADARSRDAAAKIDCDGYLCYGTLACINITLVCNGEYNCLYGDDEGYCNYTKTTTTPIPPVCGDNFDYVYDRCVLIDLFTATTWDEARYLCQLLDGDLVVLDDFNFYEELVQYIQGKGLDEHSYWVGATDRALEGVWLWVNVAPVPSGAPLWALYGCTGGYDLEPNPTEAEGQDCAFLDKDRGLHMSDAACSDSLAAICQTTAN